MQSDLRLLRAVAGQFLMGAIMGALFVGAIMLVNVEIVAAIINGSAFPIATTAVIFAGPMLYLAFWCRDHRFSFSRFGWHPGRAGPRRLEPERRKTKGAPIGSAFRIPAAVIATGRTRRNLHSD